MSSAGIGARRAARRGVDYVRPEWLRHTGASIAYNATGNMKAVANRLGHTNTRMVDDVYVQVYRATDRELADAIDAMAAKALGVQHP